MSSVSSHSATNLPHMNSFSQTHIMFIFDYPACFVYLLNCPLCTLEFSNFYGDIYGYEFSVSIKIPIPVLSLRNDFQAWSWDKKFPFKGMRHLPDLHCFCVLTPLRIETRNSCMCLRPDTSRKATHGANSLSDHLQPSP